MSAPRAAPVCTDVDFTTDVTNCGACGHDCLGGACEAGVCGPFQAVAPPKNVGAIAVTTSGIHWIDSTSVVSKCAPAGCPDGGGVDTLTAQGCAASHLTLATTLSTPPARDAERGVLGHGRGWPDPAACRAS